MRSVCAFFALLTFDVVVGQETQEELDYKEKHFCEGDETIKALEGVKDSFLETKRCGMDKHGKATCVLCNTCASGFQREGTSCKGVQETKEELDYKEKHFCEDDETTTFLQGSDGASVSETKRCGFDKHGKPRCVYCNKCANGSEREGATCAGNGAFGSSPKSVGMGVAAFAIVLAVLAGLFFVCKGKRGTRSDSGNVGKSEGLASRRAGGRVTRSRK
jgi:hypothetical protein